MKENKKQFKIVNKKKEILSEKEEQLLFKLFGEKVYDTNVFIYTDFEVRPKNFTGIVLVSVSKGDFKFFCYSNGWLHREDGPAEMYYFETYDGNIKLSFEDWYYNGFLCAKKSLEEIKDILKIYVVLNEEIIYERIYSAKLLLENYIEDRYYLIKAE